MTTGNRIGADHTARYPRISLNQFSVSVMQLRDPFVQMWWSAALPGFGHLMIGKYMQGFILVGWEFFANIHAHLNDAIIHSMLGDFREARATLDMHWLLLYISVYVFCIWDVYSRCIDSNKVALLAIRENAPIPAISLGPLGLHGFRPVERWKTVFLNAFMPGLGQLYVQRLTTGIFAIGWWLVSCYYSHFPIALYDALMFDWEGSRRVFHHGWSLFLPSLYCFCLYDAVSSTVVINRLFESEQAEYLKRTFQKPDFQMPI